jgi:catechol 2,3-dioxygenase-like lactoylglutathione lyase family enzyme
MSTAWTMTFDCANPATMAAFWKLALGYVDAPVPVGFDSWEQWLTHFGVPEEEWEAGASLVDPEGVLPRLSLLKVPESKTAKNRLHLDIQVGGGRHQPFEIRWPKVTDLVDRLTAAGASVIREDTMPDGTPDHVVMADPEGNEFCVL